MKDVQKALIAIYLPLTILILAFDNIYPQEDMVQYLRYIIMITLALAVAVIQKRFFEQKVMALSFACLVIADFFLVFSTTIDSLEADLTVFGILGFMMAYICLIAACQKNFNLGRKELAAAAPIAAIYICVMQSFSRYVSGVMFAGVLAFGLVLGYMLWTAVCTLFRNYFSRKASAMIAASGTLMFICDIGVAYSLFHPYYSSTYIPILKNIIWAAYIPGWTLLAVVIAEEELYRKDKKGGSF